MADQRFEEEPERVVIRDRRRIDPVTGQVRQPAGGPVPQGGEGGPADAPPGQGESVPASADSALIDELRTELAERENEIGERTEDLQRLQAQFVNYRKRMDRDLAQAGQLGVATLVTEMLPILDDIDRARSHGDLNGGFRAVADSLESVVSKAGLEAFGEVGDVFDPNIHEAVTHSMSSDVVETVCSAVMRRGYRLGERLLRPAMVAVAEPEHPLPHRTGHDEEGRDKDVSPEEGP